MLVFKSSPFFRSYEDVMAQAGTLVAEEWAVVRSSDTSGLYGAVASALDATEPAPRNPAPKRATTFMKPEASSKDQVEALTEALHCLESMKPRGNLTVALEREWRAALSRKAAAKVREAEAATVRGALLTFSELQVHMADRGRPFPPDSVDLDAFLFEGTEAQSRALAGLKWLAKAGQLDYDLSAYDFRGQPQREARQAAVAEPPMLALLERQIEQLYNSRNPQWRAMLGLWACGFGVLRLVHLGRASPRRLSRSTFHFHCGRGKQKGNRHGFDFAIPGHFMSGWDWASRWLEEWQDLPASKRATSGLNFSEHGVPYTTPQTVRIAQDLFTPLLGGLVASLTSYSFRRVGPTYATLAGWTPQNQLALGRGQRSRATPCH